MMIITRTSGKWMLRTMVPFLLLGGLSGCAREEAVSFSQDVKPIIDQNCLSCHTGPGSREEIRTTHPERTRCMQCHVGAILKADWGDP